MKNYNEFFPIFSRKYRKHFCDNSTFEAGMGKTLPKDIPTTTTTHFTINQLYPHLSRVPPHIQYCYIGKGKPKNIKSAEASLIVPEKLLYTCSEYVKSTFFLGGGGSSAFAPHLIILIQMNSCLPEQLLPR